MINVMKCFISNCWQNKFSNFRQIVCFFNSWCQIVRVPNCPFLTLGAKLSAFTSWCQIVRFEIARCQIVWCQKCPIIHICAYPIESASTKTARPSLTQVVLVNMRGGTCHANVGRHILDRAWSHKHLVREYNSSIGNTTPWI